jgi:hypothetical protein
MLRLSPHGINSLQDSLSPWNSSSFTFQRQHIPNNIMYMVPLGFLFLAATGINPAEIVARSSYRGSMRRGAAARKNLEHITRHSFSSTQEKCTSQPLVDTLVEIDGTPTLLATCDYMSGQLNQPDSKAGKYVGHVKDYGGESCTFTSPCVEVCFVNVANGSAGGVGDLLNELKKACSDAGGEYCEQQA